MVFPEHMEFRYYITPERKEHFALYDRTFGSRMTYLELTQDIVDDAEQSLGVKLSAHIYLLLTDHLHFAVERQQKGLVVTNRIFWEIKHFYPKEYAVGQRGLQKVKAKLGIELPDEEAGNIAFHIVNARQDPQAGYDAMRAAQLIGELSNIVTYSMHCPVSTESKVILVTTAFLLVLPTLYFY